MAKNSLFAILLKKPWWVSLGIAALMAIAAVALLPEAWRAGGALSGFPFVIIAVMSAWRQRGLPSAARIEQTQQAVAALAWPAFAALLEQTFARDGYAVVRSAGTPVDFTLERQGRRMLVAARRWKSARTSLDTLRALQTAREASEGLPTEALVIGLGELTDSARAFAAEHRIAVWQAFELAHALRREPLEPGAKAG